MKNEKYTVRYSIILPRDLWIKAKIKATREGKKLSEVIRGLLVKWVEENNGSGSTVRLKEESKKFSEFSPPEHSSDSSDLPDFLQDNPWVAVLSRKHS